MNVYDAFGEEGGDSAAPDYSLPGRAEETMRGRQVAERAGAAPTAELRPSACAGDAPPSAPGGMDDHAWVAKVRSGDKDAAHALVRRLYPTILRSVRGRLHRCASQEDVVQSVFVKIFGKLGQFRGSAPLEHWAARIAVNTCINHGKCQARRLELRWTDLTELEKARLQYAAVDEHTAHDVADNLEMLTLLLSQLNPEEQKVIHLLHIEERSVQEISRVLGCSVAAVKVKAFRSRGKMRKLWRQVSASERKYALLPRPRKKMS